VEKTTSASLSGNRKNRGRKKPIRKVKGKQKKSNNERTLY